MDEDAYGDEEGSQDPPTEDDGAVVSIPEQVGINEEEELKMKIVLYYHTLVSNFAPSLPLIPLA